MALPLRMTVATLFALGVALVAGCSSDEPLPPAPAAPAPGLVAQASARDEESSEEEAPPEPSTAYQPPFPNRRNPFAPVRARPTAVKKTNSDSGETVVLQGFANVDEPQVILAIDGVVTPLGVGAERYGVKVIKIQPPEVVLQRGRGSRWTATLD